MRKVLGWVGYVLALIVTQALMNRWKPQMGLGDVVWLVVISFAAYYTVTTMKT